MNPWKPLRRRRLSKFIPDSDSDFAFMGRRFADGISRDPARYHLSADEARRINEAVEAYRAALLLTVRKGTRTPIAIMQKDRARAEAERVIRKYANGIRANEDISATDKLMIHVKERPKRLKDRTCPQKPPFLVYKGLKNESGITGGMHILHFSDWTGSGSSAKPDGAARLELFVELVVPGEPIPRHPGELSGGRPWYLRSFTRTPIEVAFPVPATPMLIVYWGRWADATGNTGPFSATAVARVEGWAHPTALPQVETRNTQRRITTTQERPVRTLESPPPRKLLPPADEEMEPTHTLETMPAEAMEGEVVTVTTLSPDRHAAA